MFNCIINFFNNNKNKNKNENTNYIFNKEYRNSYNKLWIQQIQNYYP